MWSNSGETSIGLFWGRRTWGPLFLIIAPSIATVVFSYMAVELNGSYQELFSFFNQHGFIDGIKEMYPSLNDQLQYTKYIIIYSIVELLFMKFLPGKEVQGPVAPSGHVPVYKANGVPAFFASILSYICLDYFNIIQGGFLYKNIISLFAFLNLFGFLFCVMLYIKGHIAPSSKDNTTSSNPLFDFYWGIELYPRIFGFDVKTFTNCRFGMMGWAILLLDYCYAQYYTYGAISDSILVAATIQLVYIFKFFIGKMVIGVVLILCMIMLVGIYVGVV